MQPTLSLADTVDLVVSSINDVVGWPSVTPHHNLYVVVVAVVIAIEDVVQGVVHVFRLCHADHCVLVVRLHTQQFSSESTELTWVLTAFCKNSFG